MIGSTSAILADFEAPSTKDFVWGCWGGSLRIGGLSFCMNFIYLLILLGFVLLGLLIWLSARFFPG